MTTEGRGRTPRNTICCGSTRQRISHTDYLPPRRRASVPTGPRISDRQISSSQRGFSAERFCGRDARWDETAGSKISVIQRDRGGPGRGRDVEPRGDVKLFCATPARARSGSWADSSAVLMPARSLYEVGRDQRKSHCDGISQKSSWEEQQGRDPCSRFALGRPAPTSGGTPHQPEALCPDVMADVSTPDTTVNDTQRRSDDSARGIRMARRCVVCSRKGARCVGEHDDTTMRQSGDPEDLGARDGKDSNAQKVERKAPDVRERNTKSPVHPVKVLQGQDPRQYREKCEGGIHALLLSPRSDSTPCQPQVHSGGNSISIRAPESKNAQYLHREFSGASSSGRAGSVETARKATNTKPTRSRRARTNYARRRARRRRTKTCPAPITSTSTSISPATERATDSTPTHTTPNTVLTTCTSSSTAADRGFERRRTGTTDELVGADARTESRPENTSGATPTTTSTTTSTAGQVDTTCEGEARLGAMGGVPTGSTNNAGCEGKEPRLLPSRAPLIGAAYYRNPIAAKVGTLLATLERELVKYNDSGALYSFLSAVTRRGARPPDTTQAPSVHFATAYDQVNWPLDSSPTSRIKLRELYEMALRDCPEEALAIAYILDKERFLSLLCPDTPMSYPGRTNLPKADVQQLLEEEVWEPVPRRQVRTYITAFTIPKLKKQTRRLICNAIPLNDRMIRIPDYKLQLPGLADIRKCILHNNWFIELDGKSWFNQFPIQPWFRNHLAVRVHNNTYRWTTLPMGWNNSVDVSTAASRTLQAIPLPETMPLTCVDNLCRFGQTEEAVIADAEKVLKRASSVNAVLTVTTPANTMGTILGVSVDLVEKTMCLPESFVKKVQEVLNVLLEVWSRGLPITVRHAWALMGNLIWGLRVLHLPLFTIRRTLWWVRKVARALTKGWAEWGSLVHLPPMVKRELLSVMSLLVANKPHQVRAEDTEEIPLYTDACETGWGAVLEGSSIKVTQGSFPSFIREQPIAIKELWAVIEGIKRVNEKGTVHIFCDNTNVVSWISKWHANNAMATRLLKKLYQELDGRDPRITWIRSEMNPADAPSRGLPFGGLGSY